MKVICIYYHYKYNSGRNLTYGKIYDVKSYKQYYKSERSNRRDRIEIINDWGDKIEYTYSPEWFIDVTNLYRKKIIQRIFKNK